MKTFKQSKAMKKTSYTLLALLTGAGAWTLTSTIAQQGRPAGGPPSFVTDRQASGRPAGGPPAGISGRPSNGRPAGGPPAFVQALPEIYGVLEAADVNGDNQLDADEQAVLLSAMLDGTLTKPEWLPTPPEGVEVPAEAITQRMAGLYGTIAPFDANNDGELTRDELGAFRAAAMSGEIEMPSGGQGKRGGAQGGRPFGPPQGAGRGQRPDEVPAFAENLPAAFAILSAADADQNGTLSADEQATLVEAIKDGTISKPEGLPTAPEGVNPSPENVVKRLAGMYTRLQRLDINENGLLEEDELSAMSDRSQRPGRPQSGFRGGRPEGAGRPDASTQSNRGGRRPFEGSRPGRPQR